MSNISCDEFMAKMSPAKISRGHYKTMTDEQKKTLITARAAGYSWADIATRWTEVYGWGSDQTLRKYHIKLLAEGYGTQSD